MHVIVVCGVLMVALVSGAQGAGNRTGLPPRDPNDGRRRVAPWTLHDQHANISEGISYIAWQAHDIIQDNKMFRAEFEEAMGLQYGMIMTLAEKLDMLINMTMVHKHKSSTGDYKHGDKHLKSKDHGSVEEKPHHNMTKQHNESQHEHQQQNVTITTTMPEYTTAVNTPAPSSANKCNKALISGDHHYTPKERLVASSYERANAHPHCGRIGVKKTDDCGMVGWIPRGVNDENKDWIQVEFEKTMTVNAVATAPGNKQFSNYVSQYYLFYGTSASSLQAYPDMESEVPGTKKLFTVSSSELTEKMLEPPIQTKFLRLRINRCQPAYSCWIRWEVYGCPVY